MSSEITDAQFQYDSDQLKRDAVVVGALQQGPWQDVMLRYAQAVDERDVLIAALRERAYLPTRFAALVLQAHRNDGSPSDVDGSWLEETAEANGLLERFVVNGPCGGECACEDGDYCFRLTDVGQEIMAALAPPEPRHAD